MMNFDNEDSDDGFWEELFPLDSLSLAEPAGANPSALLSFPSTPLSSTEENTKSDLTQLIPAGPAVVLEQQQEEDDEDDESTTAPGRKRKKMGRKTKENSARFRMKESEIINALREALKMPKTAKKPEILQASLDMVKKPRESRNDHVPSDLISVALVNSTPACLLSLDGKFLDMNLSMLRAWALPSFDSLRGSHLFSRFCDVAWPKLTNAMKQALDVDSRPLLFGAPVAPVLYQVRCPIILETTRFSSDTYTLYFCFTPVLDAQNGRPSALQLTISALAKDPPKGL